MKKNKGLELLNILQCLYQQKIISRDDKTKLASEIRKAMSTNTYTEVLNILYDLEPLKEEKTNLIGKAIEIVNN